MTINKVESWLQKYAKVKKTEWIIEQLKDIGKNYKDNANIQLYKENEYNKEKLRFGNIKNAKWEDFIRIKCRNRKKTTVEKNTGYEDTKGPSYVEFSIVIRNMNANKSAETDGIDNEMMNHAS
ncbi:hypothetical protein HHI36_012368 [Cryptolaemus montrouzieri]|uniref:Uncharacterized protein n=1 Tax=Cryptolaemus montrouzieri TaxID=559131 RepID=A0ABD2NE99_9CUCU